MSSNSRPLLTLSGLSASIGRQPVLQGVSLSLAAGRCLAVVGGSGAGKSTLLRLIMGLQKPARPFAGRLEFRGEARDLATSSGGKPEGISFVPQSPAHGFDPLQRLQYHWDQLRRLTGWQTRQEAALNALGLPALAVSYPHEWSRGMQQRLLVAMALAEQPDLLILDEPTSALDPLIAAQVLSEVQMVARAQNIAVMIVTHDLSLAAQFADEIAILHQGALVDQGPTARVLSDPSGAYAADLVAHRQWSRAPAFERTA